jgi:hypothetical protein
VQFRAFSAPDTSFRPEPGASRQAITLRAFGAPICEQYGWLSFLVDSACLKVWAFSFRQD